MGRLYPRFARLGVLVALLGGRALADAPAPCPQAAVLAIFADNQSADASVLLTVEGERLASGAACDNTTTAFATAYATTVTCDGPGVVRCGRIAGLAPGAWVHRVSLQVAGSDPQEQAQRTVLLAGTGGEVSNVAEWTVYGRTFVVTQPTDDDLLAAIDAAAAYTAATPRPALVRFDRTVFPGASTPQTIDVKFAVMQPGNVHVCEADDVCPDGRHTAYCLDGSRITVDALDADAEPGGVVLRVGTCGRSLLRMNGSDDVLRGLVLEGSQKPMPTIPLDTIAVSGASARRNRLEQCVVHGPTLGDGVSIENGAGQPDAGGEAANVIADSEITGAEDKGIKIGFGGMARVERSCVHGNTNGGIQVTLGGSAELRESVVQHNRGGPAQNGLFVGVPETVGDPNTLVTRGNVVRFNGARGISVVNNAVAILEDDVVSDNYQAGLRVETTLAGAQPSATVRGGAFVCNYAPGVCLSGGGQVCRTDDECSLMLCSTTPGSMVASKGVGASLDACVDPGCLVPSIDLGLGGDDVGRNAFALNANPGATAPGGVNLSTSLTGVASLPAAGNQWEHCDVPALDPVNPNKCYVDQVAMLDVRLADASTAPLDLGSPTGPRHGPPPVVATISPGRPRAGDLVRVYGGSFNAIDGAACHPSGVPADACSAENPAVAVENATDVSQGNHVTVTIGPPGSAQSVAAAVHAVTPSMLVFAMPVDCYAPAWLRIDRGNDLGTAVPFCDPDGCVGRPSGAPCDDDDVCTVGEACAADGTCDAGAPLPCTGQCLTSGCDPVAGCAPRPGDSACEDGDACTVGDHCSGTGADCVAGAPRSCAGQCLSGACDVATGCVSLAVTATCDDSDACTTGDHCTGAGDGCAGTPIACDDGNGCTVDDCDPGAGCGHTVRPDGAPCVTPDLCRGPATCAGGVCDPGPAVACDDGDACTADGCDPARGCANAAYAGYDGITCHFTQIRALVGSLTPQRANLVRTLLARVGCIERRIAAAEAATTVGATKRFGRSVGRALRCVRRYGGLVRRATGLTTTLRGQLRRQGDELEGAIEALRHDTSAARTAPGSAGFARTRVSSSRRT